MVFTSFKPRNFFFSLTLFGSSICKIRDRIFRVESFIGEEMVVGEVKNFSLFQWLKITQQSKEHSLKTVFTQFVGYRLFAIVLWDQ